MPTKKVWPRKGEGGREEGGEVVIERRRRLSWPKRDDDPCAHACRPCGIGLSVCQCERRQLTRSRRRACRGPSDVTSCPLASRDLVWTTAHQGTQKVRASSMFGRAENCHRRSSGTWFSSGGSPPTFAPTYFSLPRVQYILKLLMEKLDGWLISVDEDETGDGDGWYKNSRVIVCDQREEMWFRYRRWILKTVNW